MKIFTRLGTVLIICFMVISFGGCSFWFGGGSDLGGGSGGSSGGRPDSGTTVPLPGEPTGPESDKDEEDEVARQEMISAEAQLNAEGLQSVRTTYMPDADEVSSDPVLQADREKFYENAAYQYEIMARYILHTLQGKYGAAVAADTIEYEFYANIDLTGTFYEGKEIRNPDDKTKLEVPLNADVPVDKGNKLFESNLNAINAPVVNVALDYTVVPAGQGSACPPAHAVRDENLKWNLNGTDITIFTPIVQLNLMQMALGQNCSPLGTSNADVQTEIKKLAKAVTKLGVPETGTYAAMMSGYIESAIIGSALIARDDTTHSISYTDPSYTYYVEVRVGTDENGQPIYEWQPRTGYYEMLGAGTPHTFMNSEIYKFDYQNTIDDIVAAVLGTYSGEILATPGFVHDYPKYNRIEFTDCQPFGFYYAYDADLAEDEKLGLSGMEYREYNSAIMYPDVSYRYDAEKGEIIKDPSGKRLWRSHFYNIYIDSARDITLDVYLRIHLAATAEMPERNIILHLTRMNTDSTKSFDYEGEIENFEEKYYDEKTLVKKAYHFDETKTNLRVIVLESLLDEENLAYFLDGIENPYTTEDKSADSFRQFFGDELQVDEDGAAIISETNAFHDIFAGKLGSNCEYATPNELEKSLSIVNYFDEYVNFGKKYLCQDKGDFMEFIFDVKKDKGDDYDYSFKFSIENVYIDLNDLPSSGETAE